jgi:hypothetical protein
MDISGLRCQERRAFSLNRQNRTAETADTAEEWINFSSRSRSSKQQKQHISGSKSAADIPRELPPPPPGRYFIHFAAAKARRLRCPQQNHST